MIVMILKETVKVYFKRLSDVLMEGPKKKRHEKDVQIACNHSETRTYTN
jgi:hypothetical protein